MAARALSRDELAFGRAVLLATDSVGLSPEGAFWLWDSEKRRWDYFLVTSMFNRIGAREMYLRLHDVLREKLSDVEAREFTFYIADPNEALIGEVKKLVATKGYVSEPQHFDLTLDGRNTKVVVYRMAGELRGKSAERAERVFRILSDEFVAA